MKRVLIGEILKNYSNKVLSDILKLKNSVIHLFTLSFIEREK